VDAIVQDLSTTAVVPALRANMVAFWMGATVAPPEPSSTKETISSGS
jgi:hypothetical protein